jgi:putative phosphoesterase
MTLKPTLASRIERGSDSLYRIGLIADTHGLIRPEALNALRDSDLIIHCGDLGNPVVLEALRGLAPVRAVRVNNDQGDWAASLPLSDLVEVGGHAIYVLHNLSELAPDPAASNFTAIISGHSHKPVVKKQGMILFINPTALVPDASPCR